MPGPGAAANAVKNRRGGLMSLQKEASHKEQTRRPAAAREISEEFGMTERRWRRPPAGVDGPTVGVVMDGRVAATIRPDLV